MTGFLPRPIPMMGSPALFGYDLGAVEQGCFKISLPPQFSTQVMCGRFSLATVQGCYNANRTSQRNHAKYCGNVCRDAVV
jgi:hypothetical protein